jgi:hypothetical protein
MNADEKAQMLIMVGVCSVWENVHIPTPDA